jgi:hypothetical protein
MTKKRFGLERIFAIHFGPFAPPHFVGSSHWRVSLVVAVKGRTDGVCSPCGAGGATWMPDTPGFVMPWKLNLQHTWDGVIVMVAVPAPVDVVWRYRPLRVAFRSRCVAAFCEAACADAAAEDGEWECGDVCLLIGRAPFNRTIDPQLGARRVRDPTRS